MDETGSRSARRPVQIVRLVLGVAQMVGVLAGGALLLLEGPSTRTLAVVGITLMLSGISVLWSGIRGTWGR